MVCGSGVGNRKINCQCNVVTGFPWGYALSLIHVHFGNFPCMKESRVLPHFKCGKTHLEVRAEHILRNLVLAWKRWEPICRDDLIFYSRNIKRNQLTCFFYHFFPSKRKKSMSRSFMKMMIKTADTRRAVIHMKGFVRNYSFFEMECKEKYIFMHRIPK